MGDVVSCIASLPKRSPAFVHFLVALLVVVYALVGGAGFVYFEQTESKQMAVDQRDSIVQCIDRMIHRNKHLRHQVRARVLYEACARPHIPVPQWTFPNCVVFAFTIMATVGFSLSPQTRGGQLFFIAFALVGIPISMLVLANIGAYMKEGTCKFITFVRRRKARARDRKQNIKQMLLGNVKQTTADETKKESQNETEISAESQVEEADMDGSALLVVCVIYMFIGAGLLLALRDDGPNSAFVPSMYKTFVVMTGGDFGQMSGGRLMLVLLKLFYASVGLAIATIAIDVGSTYLKKLHNLGKKLKNAASVKVWFGGKQLSVKNLVNAVGKKCDVPLEKIQNLDLENLVENAIAEQDGKAAEPEPEDPVEVKVAPEPEPIPEEPTPEQTPVSEPQPVPEPEPGPPPPKPKALPAKVKAPAPPKASPHSEAKDYSAEWARIERLTQRPKRRGNAASTENVSKAPKVPPKRANVKRNVVNKKPNEFARNKPSTSSFIGMAMATTMAGTVALNKTEPIEEDGGDGTEVSNASGVHD